MIDFQEFRDSLVTNGGCSPLTEACDRIMRRMGKEKMSDLERKLTAVADLPEYDIVLGLDGNESLDIPPVTRYCGVPANGIYGDTDREQLLLIDFLDMHPGETLERARYVFDIVRDTYEGSDFEGDSYEYLLEEMEREHSLLVAEEPEQW